MEKLEKRNNKRKELIELSGLYGWTHQYNDRSHITFSSDPRYGTKEHNYISDLDNGNEIINFLKSHKNTNYYKGIKSFEFKAFPGNDEKDNILIQNMINIAYSIENDKILFFRCYLKIIE
jgi:hypothetical protein